MKPIYRVLLSTLLFPNFCVSYELDNYFDMSLEELLNVQITGATLTHESLNTVPASVTIFTRDQIQTMGVLTVEDLMNFVPGFSSRRSSDSGYSNTPTVRGKRSTTSGKEVLVLLDGQRLNADFSGGAFVNQHQIPLGNIDHIEFIKGASSAIYGSNAFMAVVNIITSKELNNAGAYAGSNGSYNPYVNLSINDNDFSLSTYASYSSYDGQKYKNLANSNPTTDAKDPIKRKDIQINASYKGFSVAAKYFAVDENDFYALGGVSNKNKRDIDGGFIRLGYDSSQYNPINTKIYASFRKENSDWGFVSGPVFFDSVLAEEEVAVEIQNDFSFDFDDKLVFGLEYRQPKTTSANANINGGPQFLFATETSRTIYALYVQYQKDLSYDFRITGGLRYDEYSDFGSAYSPRLGLVNNSFDSTTLKILYSQAFRAPARDELDAVNNPILLGNKNLQPEIAQTIEAVWIENMVNHTFIMTLFYTKIEDVITDASIGSGVRTWDNVGTNTFDGVEFELMDEIGEHLTIRSSLSFVTKQPDSFFRYVDTTGSIIANWLQGNWNINLNAFYQGETQTTFPTANDKIALSAYVLLNAKINYQWNKNLSLYFLGKNLIDKQYYTPTEDTSNPDGVIGQGRRVFLGLEYNF